MCMLDEIHAKCDEIYAIARNNKVERLWIVGCVDRGGRGGGQSVEPCNKCGV